MSRRAYLGGRFAAGWLVSVVMLLAVAAGHLAGFADAVAGSRAAGTDAMACLRLGVRRDRAARHAVRRHAAVPAGDTDAFAAGHLHRRDRVLRAADRGVMLATATSSTSPPPHCSIHSARRDRSGNPLLVARRCSSTNCRNLAGVLLFNRGCGGGRRALLAPRSRCSRRNAKACAGPSPQARGRAGACGGSVGRADCAAAGMLRTGVAARCCSCCNSRGSTPPAVLRGVPFLMMLAFGLINLRRQPGFRGEIYGTATWPVTHQMAQ